MTLLIKTVDDFRKALSDGQYAWPGGYPRYFIMKDNEAMSFDSCEKEQKRIESAMADETSCDDEWIPVAVDINWEDDYLFCAHSGEKIECAYPTDEEDEEDEEDEGL